MLKSIRDNGYRAIEEKYGLKRNEMKFYLYYYPTYYHLHVHLTHVSIMENTSIGRAISLEDVIENIESFDNNYYQKKTLVAYTTKSSQIYKVLHENNLI
jgi:m7GpppX diphosphatase